MQQKQVRKHPSLRSTVYDQNWCFNAFIKGAALNAIYTQVGEELRKSYCSITVNNLLLERLL